MSRETKFDQIQNCENLVRLSGSNTCACMVRMLESATTKAAGAGVVPTRLIQYGCAQDQLHKLVELRARRRLILSQVKGCCLTHHLALKVMCHVSAMHGGTQSEAESR